MAMRAGFATEEKRGRELTCLVRRRVSFVCREKCREKGADPGQTPLVQSTLRAAGGHSGLTPFR